MVYEENKVMDSPDLQLDNCDGCDSMESLDESYEGGEQ